MSDDQQPPQADWDWQQMIDDQYLIDHLNANAISNNDDSEILSRLAQDFNDFFEVPKWQS